MSDKKEQTNGKENNGWADFRTRSGRVHGTVFLNPTERGQMFTIPPLSREYESGGERKFTNQLRPSDLPHAKELINRMSNHCHENRHKAYYHATPEERAKAEASLNQEIAQTRPKDTKVKQKTAEKTR